MSTYLLIFFFIVVVVVIYFAFRKLKFQCPNCQHVQSTHKIIDRRINHTMVHGRITKSGQLDKRYNSRFNKNEIVTYGIECEKCRNAYQLKSNERFNFWSGVYTPSYVKWEIEKSVDGNESEWLQRLRNSDSALADEWSKYDDALSKSMNTQLRVLKSMGLDTSHVEDYMEKYGIKKTE